MDTREFRLDLVTAFNMTIQELLSNSDVWYIPSIPILLLKNAWHWNWVWPPYKKKGVLTQLLLHVHHVISSILFLIMNYFTLSKRKKKLFVIMFLLKSFSRVIVFASQVWIWGRVVENNLKNWSLINRLFLYAEMFYQTCNTFCCFYSRYQS